jgi:heme-degrading monooxygenase HmoA
MNQATEMLRLFEASNIDAALARLDSLFQIMARQHGFIRAEVLRSLVDPRRLLVLHAWRDIGDWQRFQTSETKIDFTDARPAALYEFLPCPMNWLSRTEIADAPAPMLRRELARAEKLEPLAGPGVVSSDVFAYQDDDPAFQSLSMRLTRYAEAPRIKAAQPVDATEDEMFESLLRRSVTHASAIANAR